MKRLICLLTVVAIFATTGTAQADVVQLDFGSTGGVYAGTNAPAGITDAVWSGVGTGGGVTLPSGVIVDLGRSGNGGGAIDWTTDLTDARDNAAGNPVTGIYDTLLTSSWFFGRNSQNLGVRVSGLAPGEYDVFSINREPDEFGRSYDVGIGVGDIADLSGLAVTSLAGFNTTDPAATAWVDGFNFATERVTVTSATDFITVIVDPTAAGANTEARFASISGLQIVPVAVPEPSSAMLVGLGLFGFVARRCR